MKLAFGSALDPMQLTLEQEYANYLGGHFPYIANTIM
jgi:hypothetical protein